MPKPKKSLIPEVLPEGIDPDDPFAGISIDLGPEPPQVCAVCERPRALSAFRRNKRGEIRTVCKDCEKQQPLLKEEEWKQERLQRGLHRLVMASRSDSAKCPGLVEILAEMMTLFDGPKEFAKRWFDAIAATNPGSKTQLDQFYAIMKMIGAAQAERREQADLAEVSEEELEEAISTYVLRVVRSDDEDEPGNGEMRAG